MSSLPARLIPVLLLDTRGRLVKTVRFGKRTYIGDPFNVIRLFNEKQVDEICILDIDATKEGRSPNFELVRQLSTECFMPLAYGGGLSSRRDCEHLLRIGVEKFVFGTGAVDSSLLSEVSADFGSQAVVACIDVREERGAIRCFTRSGSLRSDESPLDACLRCQRAGAGEIMLQSIDRDGMREGFDTQRIREIASRLSVPLIALGGARDLQHLNSAIQAGASAAASGSAFTFLGDLRAVLVTYPTIQERVAVASGDAT